MVGRGWRIAYLRETECIHIKNSFVETAEVVLRARLGRERRKEDSTEGSEKAKNHIGLRKKLDRTDRKERMLSGQTEAVGKALESS